MGDARAVLALGHLTTVRRSDRVAQHFESEAAQVVSLLAIMRILIVTSDKTSWALRPFAHLMRLYWSQDLPVTVYGNTPPDFKLPFNFHFHSMGAMQPVERWTDGLIFALNQIQEEAVILMMDDYWLNRQVNAQAVESIYRYTLEHPEVARFDLTTDRLYAGGMHDYARVGPLDVIISDPHSPYHFSLQAAVWRRSWLLQCLKPHETPWQAEINGDARLRDTGALVLGTRQSPLHYTIAVQRGKFTPDGGYQTPVNALPAEDVKTIVEKGWIPDHLLERV